MSDQLTIEAELVPPQPAGMVLLTGAAELIMEVISELDLQVLEFVREAPVERAAVACTIRAADPGQAGYLKRRVERELAGLVGTEQELAGWQWRVSVAERDEPMPDLPASELAQILGTIAGLQQDDA